MSWRETLTWALFEQNPQPMLVFDSETRAIVAANDALVASYGYSKDELLNMRVDDLRPDTGELRQFEVAYDASVRQDIPGPAPFPGAWRHKKKDGTIIDVEIWRLRIVWEGRRACIALVVDVTAKKRAEAALREAEEKWTALVEASPDYVFTLDEADRIASVGRVIPGLTREHFLGKNVYDFLPLEAREELERAFAEVRRTRNARVVESRAHLPDGTTRWYEAKCLPINRRDAPPGLLFVASEVTERKRVEDALRSSEGRYRALVERADTTFLVDEKGSMIYVNEPAARGLGFTPDELTGRRAAELVHPDDYAWVSEELRKVLLGAGSSAKAEFRVVRKDGTSMWVEGTVMNLLDEPRVHALVANYRDIDDRKRAEDALRASEERYRLLFDASPLAMWVIEDESFRFLAVNEKAIRTYGYSREEFLAMDIFRIRPSEDAALLREIVKNRGPRRSPTHWRHVTKDGKLLEVEVTSHPISFGSYAARLVVVNDITEKRMLEEQLHKAQRMEAVGLLAGGVAHDFNNLLGIVTGSVELAKREVAAGGDPSANLAAIVAAADRAAGLTRKLLAFSKKQVLRIETRDLREALDDFAGLLARVVGEDIDLAVRKSDEPLLVRADSSQLEQVLLNLCTNARQAMPRGGTLLIEAARREIDAEGASRIPSAKPGAYAVLSVTDSGVGMDAATRARIFEPFFTTRSEGTGLGLATVYGIVQQHGGFVTVESEIGRGATFRVFFPIATPSIRTSTPPSGIAVGALKGGREVLLVAEDEPSLRNVMTKMLSELGYAVIAVGDGQAALEAFERRRREIALVILDVVMPRMSGPDAYERMRAIDPSARVLFMTGYAPQAAAVSELVASGGHALLDKPFRMQDLAAKVREAIDA